MRDRTYQSEPPALAKLALASVLSAALALSVGCPSKGALRGNPAAESSGSSKTAGKVRPLTDRKFQQTPERLARGRYLVNGIGECFACHGPFNLNSPGWPPVRGKKGSRFDFSSGGTACGRAPNLPPDPRTGAG